MNNKKQKINKKFPRLIIERYGMDENGHIEWVDLHDEKFGEAVFIKNANRHHHGYLNDGIYLGIDK